MHDQTLSIWGPGSHADRLEDGLVRSAEREPDKIAIRAGGHTYTYDQLLARATELASELERHGFRSGDRAAILGPNGWASAVAIYGTLIAGGVMVVLNPKLRPEKLTLILEDSEARALLVSGDVLSHTHWDLEGLTNLTTLIAYRDDRWIGVRTLGGARHRRSPLSDASAPHDLAALIYTSGSTGEPKGVMMTHRSMTFSATTVSGYLRLHEDDRILSALPLAYSYGLYQLLMTVGLGATLLLEESFTYPAKVAATIREERATVFPGVPTMFASLIAMGRRSGLRLPSVTRLTNAAAALPVAFVSELRKLCTNALIYQMYGLTECKRASYLEPELIDLKPGSVGKALPGTEVYVGDEEGNRLPFGDPGLLYVRGPHVMQGYWNRPEETSKVLFRRGADSGDRVLCTGDVFTTDEDGFLYFLGRRDDMLNVGGEKVSPLEIENVLYAVEGVREAAVIGVEDSVFGQRILAFVSLVAGSELTPSFMRGVCMRELEPTHVPKDIVILDALPRTASGKIRKKSLREPGAG